MAKLYYNRIVMDKMSFADVPEKYKADVLSYAREMVAAGKLSEERFEELFGK